MNLTDTLPDIPTPPNWMPRPPKDLDTSVTFVSAHIDRDDADVTPRITSQGPALRVDQPMAPGRTESVSVFFSTDDVNVQLDLASALEVIAEQLRDRASEQFATFLAEVRREEQLHDAAEEANDESGFDSGYELTA